MEVIPRPVNWFTDLVNADEPAVPVPDSPPHSPIPWVTVVRPVASTSAVIPPVIPPAVDITPTISTPVVDVSPILNTRPYHQHTVDPMMFLDPNSPHLNSIPVLSSNAHVVDSTLVSSLQSSATGTDEPSSSRINEQPIPDSVIPARTQYSRRAKNQNQRAQTVHQYPAPQPQTDQYQAPISSINVTGMTVNNFAQMVQYKAMVELTRARLAVTHPLTARPRRASDSDDDNSDDDPNGPYQFRMGKYTFSLNTIVHFPNPAIIKMLIKIPLAAQLTYGSSARYLSKTFHNRFRQKVNFR